MKTKLIKIVSGEESVTPDISVSADVTPNKIVPILEKITKISLYTLVVLIPIWFLPITQDALNFQKQSLTILLILVALVAWFATTVNKGEIDIRLSWLHIAALAVIATVGISTITSLSRYGSFWGWPLHASDNFISILFFGLFYFLIFNTVKDTKEVLKLFLIFTGSFIIAALYAILQLYKVFIIPFPFAKVINFNTIGNLGSVAILAAIILPFMLTMTFTLKERLKFLVGGFTILLLCVLLFINSFIAWVVMMMGLLVLLFFGIWNLRKRMEFSWVSFTMVLLAIALFFVILKVSIPGAPLLPIEVSPSRNAEVKILFNTFWQNPLLGSGPGTFIFDYTKYHDLSLNQTLFWAVRFNSGASEILDWFITKGLLGGIAFLSLFVGGTILLLQMLLKPKKDTFSWMMALGLFASFVALMSAHVLYYSNFTLSFFSWLFLAAIASASFQSEKKISLSSFSWLSVVWSVVFLLVVILSTGLLFIGGEKYVAEVRYFKGIAALAQGDTTKGINYILLAARANPSSDLYWRNLSQLYLSNINEITLENNLSADEKNQKVQAAVNNTIASANQAIAINPANVENWNVRGFVYRSLIGIEGADALAIESYTRASQLEPNSPFSFTELGRVYLAQAQNLANQKNTEPQQEEALQKSLENLNKAVTLKADYAPAHYLIALVYGAQGRGDEEIEKLEKTRLIAPNDLGLAFKLGVFYYQKNLFDKAQKEFEDVLIMNPNYSNGLYMLGLVYDRQGQKNKAIEQFKKVNELNPDNEEIKKILDNLNNGKPVLSGIQTSEPPIDETPPEITSKKK